jgi:hypothetical protein
MIEMAHALYGYERYDYPRAKEIFERSVSKLEGYGYLMEPEMIISCKRNLHDGYEDVHYYDDPIEVLPQTSNQSKERSFIKRWFLDTTKRTYAAMDFLPPPMQVPDGVFNTWQGFKCDKISSNEPVGDVEPFLYHLSLMAGNGMNGMRHTSTLNRLVKWFGQLIQEPGKVNPISLIIASREGAGKHILFNQFAEHILDPSYLFSTCDPSREVYSKFSKGRFNMLLICMRVERVKKSKSRALEQYMYKQKRINPMHMHSFGRLVYLSNNMDITAPDSNHMICKMSGERTGDQRYFEGFVRYMREACNQKAIIEYLRTVDLTASD